MALTSIPIPETSVKLKLSYIFSAICLILTLGVAAGSYRQAYKNTEDRVSVLQKDVEEMKTTLTEIKQLLKDRKIY